MNKKQTIKELRALAKRRSIDVKFSKKPILGGEMAGAANVVDSVILIDTKKELHYMLSVFFHEFSHILDYRDGLYKDYYRIVYDDSLSDAKRKQYAMRWALSAERHADYRGAKLLKQYYPKVKFQGGYSNKRKAKRVLKALYE